MCSFCSVGLPVCVVDNSCSSAIAQNVKTIFLAATPIAAGAGVWLQTKLIKKRQTKTKKVNEKI